VTGMVMTTGNGEEDWRLFFRGGSCFYFIRLVVVLCVVCFLGFAHFLT
jgi:hypothetical protein